MDEVALKATVIVTIYFQEPSFSKLSRLHTKLNRGQNCGLRKTLSLYNTSCFMHKKIHH